MLILVVPFSWMSIVFEGVAAKTTIRVTSVGDLGAISIYFSYWAMRIATDKLCQSMALVAVMPCAMARQVLKKSVAW